MIFEFKGNTIDFAKSSSGVVVDLDPASNPKCLDFRPLKGFGVFKKGLIFESVYKLDGDTLTWAVHIGRERNRPISFDKPTDAGAIVIVLNRVRE